MIRHASSPSTTRSSSQSPPFESAVPQQRRDLDTGRPKNQHSPPSTWASSTQSDGNMLSTASSPPSSSSWQQRTLAPLLPTKHTQPTSLSQPSTSHRPHHPHNMSPTSRLLRPYPSAEGHQDGRKSPPSAATAVPSASTLHSSPIALFQNREDLYRRRNRSASEATAPSLHTQEQDRTMAERAAPLMGSSMSERVLLPPPPPSQPSMMSSNKASGGMLNSLPPLSRFSANIRRSNTLSALQAPALSSVLGSGIQPRKLVDPSTRSNVSRASLPSLAPALPTHLASPPHRAFSRKYSDTGLPRSPSSALPPISIGGGGLFSAGSNASVLLSPSSTSSAVASSSGRAPSRENSFAEGEVEASPRKQAKTHVASACLNCKRAHLACDVSRPCRRCINLGKTDTCVDVVHKKRGRPRLRDREVSVQSMTGSSRSGHSVTSSTGVRNDDAMFVGGISPHNVDLSSMPFSAYHHRGSLIGSGMETAADSFTMHPSASTSQLSGLNTSQHGYSLHRESPHAFDASFGQPAFMEEDRANHRFIPNRSHAALRSNAAVHGRGRSFSAVNPPSWVQHRQQERRYHAGELSPPMNDTPMTLTPQAAHFIEPPSPTSSTSNKPVVSFILSTSLHCVRCSEECQSVFGFDPRDLLDTSFFDLVHPSDVGRIKQLRSSLIEPVGIRAHPLNAHRDAIMSLSPAGLMMPAAGTVFLQEDHVRLRHRTGSFDTYSIRLHLGAGLGADLYHDHTLERAYIVASVLRSGFSQAQGSHPVSVRADSGPGQSSDDEPRFDGHGRPAVDAGAKLDRDASHPDPHTLRLARWHDGYDPRHFVSPQKQIIPSSAGANDDRRTSTGSQHAAMVC